MVFVKNLANNFTPETLQEATPSSTGRTELIFINFTKLHLAPEPKLNYIPARKMVLFVLLETILKALDSAF